MTYTDAVVVLEGMIKALQSHIELAQKGLIQEDCIGCREKDLETYKGILQVLEKEHNDKDGWHRCSMEWQFETNKLKTALAIMKNKSVDVGLLCGAIEKSKKPLLLYNNSVLPLNPDTMLEISEYELLKEVMELCPDSKIAK